MVGSVFFCSVLKGTLGCSVVIVRAGTTDWPGHAICVPVVMWPGKGWHSHLHLVWVSLGCGSLSIRFFAKPLYKWTHTSPSLRHTAHTRMHACQCTCTSCTHMLDAAHMWSTHACHRTRSHTPIWLRLLAAWETLTWHGPARWRSSFPFVAP